MLREGLGGFEAVVALLGCDYYSDVRITIKEK